MSLNKLPDGSPSPKYLCTVEGLDGGTTTVTITEWWYNGEKVESIEESVNDYFYHLLDKSYFEVISIQLIK